MSFIKPTNFKLAVPNKGRLKDPTLNMLHRAGYKFRVRDRSLYATCLNTGIVLIFVRSDDIPVLLHQGVVDAGITGEDLIAEKQSSAKKALDLGFGKCRLCLAIPENTTHSAIKQFEGKTIATSFPEITRSFFHQKKVKVKIIEMSGSVEVMVSLGLAEAIVDIVETGDSLKDNQLKIFNEIGTYQTSLFVKEELEQGPEQDNNKTIVRQLKRKLEGIVLSNQYVLLEYNVPMEKLSTAKKITPGFDSPTISSLEDQKKLAVRVMVPKDKIHQVIDQLQNTGATAILQTEILNCRL